MTSEPELTLSELVAEAYTNMTENGYRDQFLSGGSIDVKLLAEDMHECDSDIAKHSLDDVVGAIQNLVETLA